MKLLLRFLSVLLAVWMILRNVRSVQFSIQSPLGEWSFVKRPPATRKQLREIARTVREKRAHAKMK
ncbi:MAG: hypothetical protein IJY47_05450 [Clostridia bacterium]|nr:hypothetical protein [Clostridia bacterium]